MHISFIKFPFLNPFVRPQSAEGGLVPVNNCDFKKQIVQIELRQYLLDIANQLASENRHSEAAGAYQQFLTHYSTYEYAEQVELMLGILYSRYLNRPELAVKHLRAAEEKLTDPNQLKMCRDELARLQK